MTICGAKSTPVYLYNTLKVHKDKPVFSKVKQKSITVQKVNQTNFLFLDFNVFYYEATIKTNPFERKKKITDHFCNFF